MTNADAIERLRKIADRIWLSEQEHKAINLAIKSLSHGTCENCKYGLHAGRLVGCLNTEFNITSCQDKSFYCGKWAEDDRE